MIGRIFRKTVRIFTAIWFDDGSGAINTPWNDGDTWTE